MTCKTINNPLQYQYKGLREMSKVSVRVTILTAILVGALVRLVYLYTGISQVGNIFIFRRYHISQRINKSGRAMLKEKRRALDEKALNEKLSVMAMVLGRDLKKVIEKMEPEKNYKICTHILEPIKRLEKKQKIIVVKEGNGRSRLLIESIAFLGVVDFLRVLFSRKFKKLIKKFYKLTIVKTQQ